MELRPIVCYLKEPMSDQALILLVEDEPSDAALVKRAFSKAKVLNPVHVLNSAEEAVAYLEGAGKYKNRAEFPLPALILLDLKMPGMGGHEFLKWLRKQPGALQTLRVVVLSGLDDMRSVNDAYQSGANSFLVKPADFERFVEISQALNGYWMWLNEPPDASRPDKANGNDKARKT